MRVLFGALTSALREPLAHFLLVGVLLFLVHEWWQDRHPRDAILVTPERVAALSAGFSRIRQRAPNEQELERLVEGYVREEIAVREARVLGLDRDDSLIRARLRYKLEFLAQDSAAADPPTELELRDWLREHPDGFRPDPELAFRQVFLDPARHGVSLERDVERLLKLLRQEGAGADIRTLGDSLMVPRDIERMSLSAISRAFGPGFVEKIQDLEPEHWAGPVESGFGLHLVYVFSRRTGDVPPFDEIRPEVERAYSAAQRQAALDAYYANLRQRYEVVVLSEDDGTGIGRGEGR